MPVSAPVCQTVIFHWKQTGIDASVPLGTACPTMHAFLHALSYRTTRKILIFVIGMGVLILLISKEIVHVLEEM